jgi:hypothetical protein
MLTFQKQERRHTNFFRRRQNGPGFSANVVKHLVVTFLVSWLIFLGSYSTMDSTMKTATMALRSASQADEFEASVSMNDQNCRVLSWLEFDQPGSMQHLRTGGKVPWNALPAMAKEVAHQRPIQKRETVHVVRRAAPLSMPRD